MATNSISDDCICNDKLSDDCISDDFVSSDYISDDHICAISDHPSGDLDPISDHSSASFLGDCSLRLTANHHESVMTVSVTTQAHSDSHCPQLLFLFIDEGISATGRMQPFVRSSV